MESYRGTLLTIIDDSIGLVTANPKTAKSAIVHRLAQRFPLTAKELSRSLSKEYGMNVTYQAVHKAIQELGKEGILFKTKNQWKISPAWLTKQATFIRQTRRKYTGNKNRYTITSNYDGPQTFEFDNLTDFAVETAGLVANKVLCQKQETAYWVLEYGWWTPKFKFTHLDLLYKLVSSSPKSIHIIRKTTPFGIWMQKQYERVGGKGTIGLNVPFEDDMLVQGDWIVQVHFSPESKKIIQKYWKKWKNLEDCFREFGLKEEPKMKITATVSRNPTMARFLRKEIDRYLQEGVHE